LGAGGLAVGDGGGLSAGVQHGGSDGGDVGRGSGEDGGEGSGGGHAVGVGISGCSLVTRRGEERDSHTGDLEELVVHTSDVVLGISAGTDLALTGLGPTPGHGDHEGRVGRVHQGGGELVHPSLNGPEPGLGAQGQGEGILSIESGLSVGELRGEGSNGLGHGGVLAYLRVPPGQILRVVRGVSLELGNANGGLHLTTEGSGDTIHVTQHSGDHITSRDIVTLSGIGNGTTSGLQVRGLPELRQTRNEINDTVQLLRVRQLSKVTSQHLTRGNMLERIEGATENLLQSRDGSRSNDNIAASSIGTTDSN